jgi:hypothetical protein
MLTVTSSLKAVEMHNLIERLPAPAPLTSQLVWKDGVILTDSRARAEVIEFYEKRKSASALLVSRKRPY